MALGERRQGLVELTAGVEALEALPPEEHARLNRQDALSSVADISARRGSLIMQLAAMGYLADALAMAEGYFTWAAAPAPGVAQGSSTCGDARFGQGIVLAMLGRPSEAREAFVQALAAYRAVEHHFSVGTTAGWELRLIQLPYRSDRVEDRELLALEGEQALSRARDAGVVQIAPGYARLPLLLLEGRWSEAQEVARTPWRSSVTCARTPHMLWDGWRACRAIP
ncbi:MAG: hypothetical protein U0232_15050 [Thermomicrobiales bacterium]